MTGGEPRPIKPAEPVQPPAAGGQWDTLPWTEKAGAQLQSGVETLKQATAGTLAASAGRTLAGVNRIDRGQPVSMMEDPAGYADMPPEDRAALKRDLASGLSRNVGRISESQTEQTKLPRNPNADAVVQRASANDWSGAWHAFAADPVGVLQQFSFESAPLAAPSMAGGLAGSAAGGIPGLLIGLSSGSYPIEYGIAIVDTLQKHGIDPRNAAAVEAALRDPGFL
uniref:hypothetical protein n=1 Tax=Ferrovibrio sp. TaxID=1917215 RepID=UPI00311D6757